MAEAADGFRSVAKSWQEGPMPADFKINAREVIT